MNVKNFEIFEFTITRRVTVKFQPLHVDRTWVNYVFIYLKEEECVINENKLLKTIAKSITMHLNLLNLLRLVLWFFATKLETPIVENFLNITIRIIICNKNSRGVIANSAVYKIIFPAGSLRKSPKNAI